jgi:hypothetical protein
MNLILKLRAGACETPQRKWNIKEKLLNNDFGNDFLYLIPKTQAMETIIDKSISNIKVSVHQWK